MTSPSSLLALEEAKNAGRREAINDCIGLLRKWFWNKAALACEREMRALAEARE